MQFEELKMNYSWRLAFKKIYLNGTQNSVKEIRSAVTRRVSDVVVRF